jgi:fatty-acyl-CoA synthase
MVGASLIFPGRYLDGPSLHALLNRERVTLTSGVPTVWLGLLQHLQTTGGRLDTLRRLMTGGSACPRVLLDGFAALGVHVEQGWGMTEISPVGTYNRPTQATASLQGEDEIRLRLKQGRMIYGLEMRITDDAGQEVPRDGVHFGNLEVRGHWVCSSYFGETASPRADGWFPTGDVATIDPDGFMQITDRTKDVVKSGGEWISSIQLENIAVSHPDVAEAAIIGAKHPKWDERPLLLVVPKEGRTIDPAALLAIYEGQVAKWWIPDDVVIVETLPHTATGKLQKMTLRTRYQDHYL